MAATVRLAIRFTAPLIFALALVLVFAGVWNVLMFVEYNIGFYDFEPGIGLDNFTTVYAYGDIVAAVAILMVGGVVFGVLGRTLMWLEQLQRPTVRDHIRHCIVLYVMFGFLGIVLISAYDANFGANVPAGSLTAGYIAAIVCLLIAAYAIFIDGLILTLARLRSGRRSANW